MNASEFTLQWANRVMQDKPGSEELQLVAAPHTLVNNPAFPQIAAHFLVEAGLPQSCAPFLSFENIARGPMTLVQLYGSHQFSPSDLLRLAPFYVLGSDSTGNPLCLDAAHNGEIVLLDHEDNFQTRTFVASSVAALAEGLLILHTVPLKDFVQHLRLCDPPAAEQTAFLPIEASMLTD